MRSTKRRIPACANPLTLLGLVLGVGCTAEVPGQGQALLLRPGDDVLAAGSTVSVSDSVGGDVMTAGAIVTFDGYAEGSYVGAGQDQDVRGSIQGSARAAGATVRMGASVGRNVTLAGGTVLVQPQAEIERNAYLAGGVVAMSGTVHGHLYVGGGEVTVDGLVGGDVRVEAGQVAIGPNARIAGELRYRSEDGDADIHPEATITGGVQALPPREPDGGGAGLFVLRLLAFLVCGAVIVAVLPETASALAERMESRPGAALGLGILWCLLVPIAVLLAGATVVGLPLALIASALYAASLYVAPIVPSMWVGGEVLPGENRTERGRRVMRFLVGGLIVAFAILLPWIGWVARIAATAVGLGTIALMVRGRTTGSSPTVAAPTA
jgi:hypothetical protein